MNITEKLSDYPPETSLQPYQDLSTRSTEFRSAPRPDSQNEVMKPENEYPQVGSNDEKVKESDEGQWVHPQCLTGFRLRVSKGSMRIRALKMDTDVKIQSSSESSHYS